MPDDPKPKETPQETPKPAEDFKAMAAGIAESIREGFRQAAPAKTEAKPDFEAEEARIFDEYDKLAAAGKFKEAAQYLLREQNDLAKRRQPVYDPSNDIGVVALRERVLSDVRRDNAELFGKYAAEIEEEVRRLPPTEQVREAGVREALNRVKARHIDDILKERSAKAVEEALQSHVVTPQNKPLRRLGEQDDTDLHGLDVEEREMARGLRVPYSAIARAKQLETAQASRRKDRKNPDYGVDILPQLDDSDPDKPLIEPGRF